MSKRTSRSWFRTGVLACATAIGMTALGDDDRTTVLDLDFEDASTYANGWTFSGNGFHDQASRTLADSSTSNFLRVYSNSGSGDRQYTATYNLPTALTSASDYVLEFDWFAAQNPIYGNTSLDMGLYVYAGTDLKMKIIANPITTGGDYAWIYLNGSDTAESTALATAQAKTGSKESDSISSCTGTDNQDKWYHIVFKANATDGLTVKILKNDLSTVVLAETKICDFVNLTKLYLDMNKRRSNFYAYSGFDNVVATVPTITDATYVWTGNGTDNLWTNLDNWQVGVGGAVPTSAPAADSDVYIPAGEGALTVTYSGSAKAYTGTLKIARDVTFNVYDESSTYQTLYLTSVRGEGKTLKLQSIGSNHSKRNVYIGYGAAPCEIYCNLQVEGEVINNTDRVLTVDGALSGSGNISHGNNNGTGFKFLGDTSAYTGSYAGARANNYVRDNTCFAGNARGSASASWTFGHYDTTTYAYPFAVNDTTYYFGRLVTPSNMFDPGSATGITVEVGALADTTSTVGGKLGDNSNTLRKVGDNSTLDLTLTAAGGAVEAYAGTLNLLAGSAPESLTITGAGATVTVTNSVDVTPVLSSELASSYILSSSTADGVTTYTVAAAAANVDGTPYATLAEAIAGAADGDTVTLLSDLTLDARIVVTNSMTIDLGGFTITRTAAPASDNGSIFRVLGEGVEVTVKDGSIDCSKIDDSSIAKDGVYAIDVKEGASLTLTNMAITVNSECGACVYPWAGSTVAIQSGTYSNTTTTEYRHKSGWTGMAVNQANKDKTGNVATQLLFITGGTFSKVDPSLGDDSWSDGEETFLAEGYKSTANGDGSFTVSLGTVTWVGGESGGWNTASNWSPAAIPTADTDVVFTNAVTVTFDGGNNDVANPRGYFKSLTLNTNVTFAAENVGNWPAIAVYGNITGTGTLTLYRMGVYKWTTEAASFDVPVVLTNDGSHDTYFSDTFTFKGGVTVSGLVNFWAQPVFSSDVTIEEGATVSFGENPAPTFGTMLLKFNAVTNLNVGAVTVAETDTVTVSFGEGALPTEETTLLTWTAAPEGSFVLSSGLEGTLTAGETGLVYTPPVYLASVTSGETTTYFTNWNAAVDAIVEGCTFTLLANEQFFTTRVQVPMTLDLNGYSIMSYAYGLLTQPNMTVVDNSGAETLGQLTLYGSISGSPGETVKLAKTDNLNLVALYQSVSGTELVLEDGYAVLKFLSPVASITANEDEVNYYEWDKAVAAISEGCTLKVFANLQSFTNTIGTAFTLDLNTNTVYSISPTFGVDDSSPVLQPNITVVDSSGAEALGKLSFFGEFGGVAGTSFNLAKTETVDLVGVTDYSTGATGALSLKDGYAVWAYPSAFPSSWNGGVTPSDAIVAKYATWKAAYPAATDANEVAFLLNIDPATEDQTIDVTAISVSGTTVTITVDQKLASANGVVYAIYSDSLTGLATPSYKALEFTDAETSGSTATISDGKFYKIAVGYAVPSAN